MRSWSRTIFTMSFSTTAPMRSRKLVERYLYPIETPKRSIERCHGLLPFGFASNFGLSSHLTVSCRYNLGRYDRASAQRTPRSYAARVLGRGVQRNSNGGRDLTNFHGYRSSDGVSFNFDAGMPATESEKTNCDCKSKSRRTS